MRQRISFCTTSDGVRIAYAVAGSGPPLIRVGGWLTHVERDWGSPVWQHWLRELTHSHTLARFDIRGSGLSDHDTTASPENAVRLWRGFHEIDVRDLLPHIHTATLVAHVEGDDMVPFELGRSLASQLPDAHFYR